MNNIANGKRVFRFPVISAPTAGITSIFPMPSQRGKRSSTLIAAVPTIPPINGANAESTDRTLAAEALFGQGGKSGKPAEANGIWPIASFARPCTAGLP